jgi:lycopene beta-cyclase
MSFDYAIIGLGAAGFQLAIKMVEDPYFKDKKIALFEPDDKNHNDRTWSFWEKGDGRYDHLIHKEWEKGWFISQWLKKELHFGPYRYKTLRSAPFYGYAREKIQSSPRFVWLKEKVSHVEKQRVVTTDNSYACSHIFDSRIPKAFHEHSHRYHSLVQHFKGWFIRTPKPVFDPDRFVMMDYRLKWKGETSFTYILPSDAHHALVEFTLFNQTLLEDATYDDYLRSYISDYLNIDEFDIVEVEKGIIPMSTYPFHMHHKPHHSRIGTAGGWVRPSSGYSFKNGDRYSDRIVANIKAGKVPHAGVAVNRFRFYDRIFLNVLCHHNTEGEKIFSKLYGRTRTPRLLRFLDEESRFVEELGIMWPLNGWRFTRAFFEESFSSSERHI